MQEIRPDADEAQDCWARGVQPLVDTYGTAALNLIHALVASAWVRFPVPVFITGTGRSGIDPLLEACADLSGNWPVIRADVVSLPLLRLATRPGQALLVDNAAPAGTPHTPSMFEQISDEMLDYGSPLQEPTILIATGGRRLGRELRHRSLHIPLPSPGPTRAQQRSNATVLAASARRLVHLYLEQNATSSDLPLPVRRLLLRAADTTEAPNVRCDSALTAVPHLLRKVQLPPLRPPVDQVLEATREAVRESLAISDGGVYQADGYLLLVPEIMIPRIRRAAHDASIKHYDIARSLEVARLLNTQTHKQGTQGSTTPVRVENRLQRVWKVRSTLL